MKRSFDQFYQFLDQPLAMWTRPFLALFSIALLIAISQPLWRISMEAAQYPEGLYLEIYAYKVEGGNDGQHLQEINTLNHYIGMRKLDEAAFADLGWLPFALGGLFILSLRVAAIGNVRSLVDLAVITSYVSSFALARFIYMLYSFGHHLAPDAPMKVKPFMPGVIGTKKIANFTTYSWPQLGSYLLGLFVLGLFVILLWHLISGRRKAVRERAAA